MYWQYVETVKLQSKWHTLSSAKTQFSTSHEVHNRVTPPNPANSLLKKIMLLTAEVACQSAIISHRQPFHRIR